MNDPRTQAGIGFFDRNEQDTTPAQHAESATQNKIGDSGRAFWPIDRHFSENHEEISFFPATKSKNPTTGL